MTLYDVVSLVFLFAAGSCIGSFLNVCIYRVPRDQSIVFPGSHCPHCSHSIAWYDNLPILSFFILRGRCRHCGGGISSRYVTVEWLTAVLFVLIGLQHGYSAVTPLYCLLSAGLIVAAFVDLDFMIIPDTVSLGGILSGVILSVLFPVLHGIQVDSMTAGAARLASLWSSLAGLLAGYGILWLVAKAGKRVLKRDAMGMGDVKLLGAIGAFLGYEAVLFTIFISSVLGAVVGLALMASHKHRWKLEIPYGPYISLAATIWMLFGPPIVNAYIQWITVEHF